MNSRTNKRPSVSNKKSFDAYMEDLSLYSPQPELKPVTTKHCCSFQNRLGSSRAQDLSAKYETSSNNATRDSRFPIGKKKSLSYVPSKY